MKFLVLKGFTWAGEDLVRGDTVEIPDESPKIGALTRSKFIRFDDGTPIELPAVEEVAQEIEEDLIGVSTESAPTRDPRQIVREAKAKAAVKR